MRLLVPGIISVLAGCGFPVEAAPPDARADGPRPDTGPDVPPPPDDDDPGAEWRVVETIQVACSSSTPRPSTTVLLLEEEFRVRASGECYANDFGLRTDAEYAGYNRGSGPFDTQDDVDLGLGIDYEGGGQKTPRWGAYSSDHIYNATRVGTGNPLRVQFVDPNLGNNSGSLTLEILRLL